MKNDVFYPYKGKEVSSDSKSIAFNQLAYFIENEHRILSEQNKIRRIVYPLIDKAINHGELIPIIAQIVDLKNENIVKFNKLLERTELEEVIQFSEDVAKKIQLLNFLEEIIYGKPSKYIKERSQLHKIVEKISGYSANSIMILPILFSDKSLKNNLTDLRTKWFDYDLTQEDDNLIELKDTQIKDITDLFFFNEKIMDNQKERSW
ncbi:MAG: hypothetical protein HC887_08415 [Desulfobacteraceae bacterium]|nr:hypothetical protein [Desulfobacteraceae bacterium]